MDRTLSVDEMPECRVCKASKRTNSDVQFCFSTCCGFCVCTSCWRKKFSRKTSCDECPAMISAQSFREEPLGVQRYLTGLKERKSLCENVFNAQQHDFKKVEEYYDFLELVESIVYDKVYGTLQQQEYAKERVEAYKKEHKVDIERRKLRQLGKDQPVESSTKAVEAKVHTRHIPVLRFEGPDQIVDDELKRRNREREEKEKKSIKILGITKYEQMKGQLRFRAAGGERKHQALHRANYEYSGGMFWASSMSARGQRKECLRPPSLSSAHVMNTMRGEPMELD